MRDTSLWVRFGAPIITAPRVYVVSGEFDPAPDLLRWLDALQRDRERKAIAAALRGKVLVAELRAADMAVCAQVAIRDGLDARPLLEVMERHAARAARWRRKAEALEA